MASGAAPILVAASPVLIGLMSQIMSVAKRATTTPRPNREIGSPAVTAMSWHPAFLAKRGIDKPARRVYVHSTPNAEGSNP